MTRMRMIRDEAPLPDEAILVRGLKTLLGGRTYDRGELRDSVLYNFDEFGYYGLSLWVTSHAHPLDWVLGEKLRRSRRAALNTAASLRDTGLGLVPSGKPPHFDTSVGDVYGSAFGSVQVVATSAEDLVDRFRCDLHCRGEPSARADRRRGMTR